MNEWVLIATCKKFSVVHSDRPKRAYLNPFSVWQDNVILYLHVSVFIPYNWGDFVDFKTVTNRSIELSQSL